jgi:hypothetical protein
MVSVVTPFGVELGTSGIASSERSATFDIVGSRDHHSSLVDLGDDFTVQPKESVEALVKVRGLSEAVRQHDGEPHRRREQTRGHGNGVEHSEQTVDVERRTSFEPFGQLLELVVGKGIERSRGRHSRERVHNSASLAIADRLTDA